MRQVSKWLVVLGSVCVVHAQPSFPLYLNSGGGSYIDNLSDTWVTDAYFMGGAADACNCVISNAGYLNPVYSTRRYGSSFSYIFTGIPTGTYSIVFKFADWQVQSAGARVFNVTVNGAAVLNNYDIYAVAGSTTAHDETVTGIPAPLGVLTISFTQSGGSYPAQINGLVITRNSGPSPTVINACQEITTPGNYVLSANLSVTTDPCLNVHDTGSNTSTAINCQGNTITNTTGSGYAVKAVNVPNFALSNCTFVNSTNLYTVWSSGSPYTSLSNLTLYNGNIEIFSGSDYSSVVQNYLTKGTISVYGGAQNVTVDHNVVNLNLLGPAHPVGIDVADSNGSVVSFNTIYGDMASQCQTANGSCTDDGIVVAASNGNVTSGVSVDDNTISGLFDCGIEFEGVAANVTVNNNTITQAGNVGIGGWWGFSMQGGTIANNHVDTAPGLFGFAYFAGLGYSQAEVINFYDVQVANNVLTNAVSTGGLTNFFDFSAYASSAQNVYGNTLTSNDFGGSIHGNIGFSMPSGYTDGGNNVCTSESPSYPISGFPIVCAAPSSCLVAPSGSFRSCYYSNASLSGPPTVIRTDSYPLELNWGASLPSCSSNLPTLGAACPQNMSATWNGSFAFSTGTYTFTVSVAGSVMVAVDGAPVFDRSAPNNIYTFSQTFPAAGTHTITVTYYGVTGDGGDVGLSWASNTHVTTPVFNVN